MQHCTIKLWKYIFVTVRLKNSFNVFMFRVTVSPSCYLDLKAYPMDKQQCNFELVSCKYVWWILSLLAILFDYVYTTKVKNKQRHENNFYLIK